MTAGGVGALVNIVAILSKWVDHFVFVEGTRIQRAIQRWVLGEKFSCSSECFIRRWTSNLFIHIHSQNGVLMWLDEDAGPRSGRPRITKNHLLMLKANTFHVLWVGRLSLIKHICWWFKHFRFHFELRICIKPINQLLVLGNNLLTVSHKVYFGTVGRYLAENELLRSIIILLQFINNAILVILKQLLAVAVRVFTQLFISFL